MEAVALQVYVLHFLVALGGTPTASGIFNFTAQVTDVVQTATKPFTLVINGTLVISSPSSLPSAALNVAYTTTLVATGGTGTNAWTVTAGALPPGLALAPATGVLSGTPTASGTFNFTIQVADGVQTTSKPFSLLVNASLTITTASPLPAALQNTAYSTTLVANGGAGTNSWSLSAGTLPAGVFLTPATGVLSGTPTVAGAYSFTIQVTDGVQIATKTFALTVNATFAITTTSPLPAGRAISLSAAFGKKYSTALSIVFF